ncbi:MAG: hypothetical protein JNN22_11175 [Rhodospirillales bacterium]|nr:hypothetical protein [Rhodospirillales bacterium]
MGRRAFLGGGLGLLAYSVAPAAAQMATCGAAKPPTVVVRASPLQPGYEFSQSVADLAVLSRGRAPNAGTLTHHGFRPAGLTTARFEHHWRTTVSGGMRGTRACFALTGIEVDVRLAEHRVYVARDATQVATCGRDVVMEHEGRHVRINLKCLDDARARIQQSLAAFIPSLPPLEGDGLTAQVAAGRYSQLLSKPISNAFKDAISFANSQHAAMDTNEAYARDWGKCRRPG